MILTLFTDDPNCQRVRGLVRRLRASTGRPTLDHRDAVLDIVLAGANLCLRPSKFAVALSTAGQTTMSRCQQPTSRLTVDGPSLSHFPLSHIRRSGRGFHRLYLSRVDGRRRESSPPMDNTRIKRVATMTHPPFHFHLSLFDFSAKRSVHPPLLTRTKSFLSLPLPLSLVVFGVMVSLTEGFTGGSFFEAGEEVKGSGLYAWPSMTFPTPT